MESLQLFALLAIVAQSSTIGLDNGSQYLKLMQLYSVNRQTNQLYTVIAKDCPEFFSSPDIAGVVTGIFGKRVAVSQLDLQLALAREHFSHLLEEYNECTSKKGQLSGPGVNTCSVNPCKNNGTCKIVLGLSRCTCAPGFTGDKCQSDIDDCASKPCKNGGSCVDRVDGFQCTCLAGYTGTTCNTDIDDCASKPCKNDGTCVDRVNGFQCTCPSGLTGTTCETGLESCSDNICKNNGTCETVLGFIQCLCSPGFTGDKCQYDIDECASNPCINGGTCVNMANGFQCTCLPGHNGTMCETDIDDCASAPCKNGGICVDRMNGFQCTCPVGFTGTTCSTNIDDCTSNSCMNGGRCVDMINGFRCSCPARYTGKRCETASFAFEVLDSRNVTFRRLTFLAVKVRIPSNGKSAWLDWCFDYRNLCWSFGRSPTGCGGSTLTDARYRRCHDVYSSHQFASNELDCPSHTNVRDIAMIAFGVMPSTNMCFSFYRCEPSGDCYSSFSSSTDSLYSITGIMSSYDRVGYTICY